MARNVECSTQQQDSQKSGVVSFRLEIRDIKLVDGFWSEVGAALGQMLDSDCGIGYICAGKALQGNGNCKGRQTCTQPARMYRSYGAFATWLKYEPYKGSALIYVPRGPNSDL